MTREEVAIIFLEQIKHNFGEYGQSKIDVAIESLKQESTEWETDYKLLKACKDAVDIVLDKIKAEIEQECNSNNTYYDYGFTKAIKIIERYTAESEETE